MAILEKYRRPTRSANAGYRRAAILAAMLIVAVGILYLSRESAVEAPPEASPAVAAPEPVSVAPVAVKPWQALPPAEERRLLADVVDQQPLYVREHRDAYYYLLGKVHSTPQADLEAQLDRTVKYADYAHQAAVIRGSVVEVVGQLVRLEATPLSAGVAAVPAVYEGQILDREGRMFSFVLTEPPQAPFAPGRVRPRDGLGVRLVGIFMQVLTYENRGNPPQVTATPFIIGRQLRLLPGASSGPAPLQWPWLVLAALAVAAMVLLLLRRARPPRRAPAVPLELMDLDESSKDEQPHTRA